MEWLLLMVLRFRYLRLLLFCLLLPICCRQAFGQRQDDVRLDPLSIYQASQQLQTTIINSIKANGGLPEMQHLHLVIGFSTGHFASDPVRAQAAREVGKSLLRHLLVADDRLSVYAWEMNLWPIPRINNPTAVSADVHQRLALANQFPQAPKTQSIGGHDTEQAIASIVNGTGISQNTVIVLLTNSVASVSPPGKTVIGQNAPLYTAVFKRWSLQQKILSFTYFNNKANASGATTLECIILCPHVFHGASLQSGNRPLFGLNHEPSCELTVTQKDNTVFAMATGSDDDGTLDGMKMEWGDGSEPIANGQTITHKYEKAGTYTLTLTATDDEGASHTVTESIVVHGASLWWLVTLFLLVLVALTPWGRGKLFQSFIFLFPHTRSYVLAIADRRFSLASGAVSIGAEVCYLTGPSTNPVNKGVIVPDAPPVRFARVMRSRDGVTIIVEKLKLTKVDRVIYTGTEYRLSPGGNHVLVFTGTDMDQMGIQRSVNLNISVQITRESA